MISGMPAPRTAVATSSTGTLPARVIPVRPVARTSIPATSAFGSPTSRITRLDSSPLTSAPTPCTVRIGPTNSTGLSKASSTA